jgi:hypothetical protein
MSSQLKIQAFIDQMFIFPLATYPRKNLSHNFKIIILKTIQ